MGNFIKQTSKKFPKKSKKYDNTLFNLPPVILSKIITNDFISTKQKYTTTNKYSSF